MTLIVTTISNLGIIQASDSNITIDNLPGGTGQKIFPLGFCPGALALSGSYGIDESPMDSWMPAVIADYGSEKVPSLEGFARHLTERLNAAVDPGITELLIHIAGYAKDEVGSHPEMWFVRNFHGIDETGAYINRSDDFAMSEDFWNRDYRDDCAAGAVVANRYERRYFNGFPHGRITYNILSQFLQRYLESVWTNPDWDFRRPSDISERAIFMNLELSVIGSLFEVSDYAAPFIGGESQIETIEPPGDAISL